MRNARVGYVMALLALWACGEALAGHADVGEAPPANAERPPEPADYRMDEYRKPVPATLKGATVLTSQKASELWTSKHAIFVDVYPRAPKPPNLPKGTLWREPIHHSIENATWLANVGYGVISAEIETYFQNNLEKLTGGDKSKAVVFYCLRDCWMSWNAAKRAMTYGYTNVMWYPDGTDGWQEIGMPVTQVTPAPQGP
ncbi:MAG TPA: PQQ-dependent catabolism-associated CXXCW motif protein [Hyphomicrobium sp.]|nr:PQQ-dependent catabolism-associated CXXCW motif protein [Hyphomicrobium sp.]